MYGFQIEVREIGRAGWQERSRADLNTLSVEEGVSRHGGRATRLMDLLKYWESIYTGNAALCRRFVSLLPATLRDQVSFIDVDYAEPHQFMLRAHQPNPIPGFGDELSGKRLSEFPIDAHARFCASEYIDCRDNNVPLYSLIDQELYGNGRRYRRRYTRLMLPLSDLDGRVTVIAYTCRSLQMPQFTNA